jgi:serine/threonine-protein kinase
MRRTTDLLRERIHEGGMGVVWRGAQRALALQIPVHIVEPDPAKLPELLTEICDQAHRGARSGAAVIDGFGAPLIAMERVEGTTLAERLGTGARFPLARAIDLTDKILAALAVIHDAGMVHGELHPDTIVIGAEGVSIIDFEAPDLGWLGASEYDAPELLAGGLPTVASDIFAVGAILRELIADARAPAPITRACARATASAPAERFPDTRSFAAALQLRA